MYPCPDNGTFLLFCVSRGALEQTLLCLSSVVPAYLRFAGSSAVPQGRCLWKHKQSFTCRVLQIMCALEQNRLCCLKSAWVLLQYFRGSPHHNMAGERRAWSELLTVDSEHSGLGLACSRKTWGQAGACFGETCMGWKAGPSLSVVHHAGFSAFTNSAPVSVIPIQAPIA